VQYFLPPGLFFVYLRLLECYHVFVRQIITIKDDGSFLLPKELHASWNNAEVYITVSDDWILIQRLTRPSFKDLDPKLRAAGKMITQREIDEEVTAVRRGDK